MYMIVFLVAIGAAIGWMTNVMAIKMLFRPIDPIRIPLFGWKLQGLMPKRKAEIARSIGEAVEQELVSIEEIMDRVIEESDKTKFIEMIKARVMEVAARKMPSLIPSAMRGMLLSYLGDVIDEEGEAMITTLSEQVVHHAVEKVSLADIIEEKIMSYPFGQVEAIVLRVAKKELKHIEWLGGVLGGTIGLVQGLVLLFTL